MVEPLASSDPRRIGPYQFEGRLGAGGMGQVFLGTSVAGRRVAVKVIRPELAATAQFRARFAREVEAARRVGGFHTAQIIDADPEAASATVSPNGRVMLHAHALPDGCPGVLGTSVAVALCGRAPES